MYFVICVNYIIKNRYGIFDAQIEICICTIRVAIWGFLCVCFDIFDIFDFLFFYSPFLEPIILYSSCNKTPLFSILLDPLVLCQSFSILLGPLLLCPLIILYSVNPTRSSTLSVMY